MQNRTQGLFNGAPSTPPAPLKLLASPRASWAGWLVLLVLPLLLVPIVPTQDGPFHLAQAQWLADLGWHGERPALVARFLEWNPRLDPYFGVYPFLAVPIHLGVDTLLAYKAVFVLYALLWLASTWAVARSTQRPVLAVLLCAPLAFGQFLHAGFLPYVFGLLGFFAFTALCQGTEQLHPVPRGLLLMLGGLVAALMHFVAIVAVVVWLCANVLARWRPNQDRPHPKLGWVGHILVPALAMLPALTIALGFVWATRHQRSAADLAVLNWPPGLKALLTADHLVAFSRVEMLWALPWLLTMLALCAFAWQLRREPWSLPARRWAWFTALVLVVVLVEVRNAQGVSLSERLVPLAWAGAAFAIADRLPAVRGSWWARYGAACVVLVWLCLVGQTVTRIQAYGAWSKPLQAVWDAGLSHPKQTFVNSAVAGERHKDQPAWRVQPLLHANQFAAVAGQGVGLSSPVASPLIFGYALLRYRSDTDWFASYPNWEARPKEGPPLAAYSERHGGAPGVLIVSGEPHAVAKLLAARGRGICREDRSVHICVGP